MPLSEIIGSLQRLIGLDAASVGAGSIERAVSKRLEANALRDLAQYAELLRHSEAEMRQLIEAVVIPETFFYRHPEGFIALQQIVRQTLRFGSAGIRVLSVPCSTGEEPYSVAMSLLDLGLSREKFQIDASDISARSLQIAKAGVFGSHSFRGTDPDVRNRYFQSTESGVRLDECVRNCVAFEQGNVLTENFRSGSEPYDFIFCRNLLIYFDTGAQGRALARLRQLLTADGLLFVGPAEAGVLVNYGFVSARLPMSFAFRAVKPAVFNAEGQNRRKVFAPGRVRSPARDTAAEVSQKAFRPTVPDANAVRTGELELAGRLADQGRLEEAAAICENLLDKGGPSARVLYLLGLIRDGAGNQDQAMQLYRKTLYLEPDHDQAAIHLALLTERSGDYAAAKVLRARARRVLERTK